MSESAPAHVAAGAGAGAAAAGAVAAAGGRPGGMPPAGTAGGGAHAMQGTSSGFEGREDMLGRAVALALRTLKDTVPYQHEMNDALVKMHLNSVQFAKNHGLSAAYVEHDVRTMQPMLQRMKAIIDKTGDREVALIGMFDRTTCLYQLCMDLEAAPGRRTFTFPYSTVLAISRRIGQFDLTDAEMHELWLRPRLLGYAAMLGVAIEVSDIGPDNKVTVRLRD
ncbi:MAG: hypothetical protein U1F11_13920 [Steroidobacteraceae bacterium]